MIAVLGGIAVALFLLCAGLLLAGGFLDDVDRDGPS